MKIRNGFVSNSSSSSFTCIGCGEVISGWDIVPEYYDWKGCSSPYGHLFCPSCVPSEKDIEEAVSKYGEVDHLTFPMEICPTCKLEKVSNEDLFYYLVYSYKRKEFPDISVKQRKELALKDLAQEFDTYDDLMDAYHEINKS